MSSNHSSGGFPFTMRPWRRTRSAHGSTAGMSTTIMPVWSWRGTSSLPETDFPLQLISSQAPESKGRWKSRRASSRWIRSTIRISDRGSRFTSPRRKCFPRRLCTGSVSSGGHGLCWETVPTTLFQERQASTAGDRWCILMTSRNRRSGL